MARTPREYKVLDANQKQIWGNYPMDHMFYMFAHNGTAGMTLNRFDYATTDIPKKQVYKVIARWLDKDLLIYEQNETACDAMLAHLFVAELEYGDTCKRKVRRLSTASININVSEAEVEFLLATQGI